MQATTVKMNEIKSTYRLNKSSSILRIIGLIMIVASFVVFIFYTRVQERNLDFKTSELSMKDSIIEKIEVLRSRTDSLETIVENFLRYRATHSVDSLDNLYADTLDFYFKNIRNSPKETVKISDTKYWKKYNKDKFIVTGTPEILTTDSTAKAIVKGRQCTVEPECLDEIMEITFDRENKIKSVRAYYAQ